MSFESQYLNVSLKDSLQKYSFCSVLNLSTLSECIENFSFPHDPSSFILTAKAKLIHSNNKGMNFNNSFFIFFN